MIGALGWVAFSLWLAVPWIDDLARDISMPGAVAVIAGIALIPGYLNAHLLGSILFDHPPRLHFDDLEFPPVTIMIAAYNEEKDIAKTLAYTRHQDYPVDIEVVVVDDGSTDRTAEIVQSMAIKDPRIRLVRARHRGKANALSAALRTVTTPVVATLDADTLLMPFAIKRAVARMLIAPPDTVAVAGSVLVRNWSSNLLSKVQEWDYMLGIASIKREQALLQGTLVAQGAFSVFDTVAVKAAGGWPDRIGEDIVLTWALMANGGRTIYEATGIAFTDVPVSFGRFFRQRRRWARGMIEGIRDYGVRLLRKRRLFSHSFLIDCVFPYVDLCFTFAFVPGIILALTGNFMIVGPITLAVLPLNALAMYAMFRRQRRILKEVGLRVHGSFVGFMFFFLTFQFVGSPISVCGYALELFRAPRNW